MTQFVKIRSWHVVKSTMPRYDKWYGTLCGRWVASLALVDELPKTEKSCESCLRILAQREDH